MNMAEGVGFEPTDPKVALRGCPDEESIVIDPRKLRLNDEGAQEDLSSIILGKPYR